MTKSVVGLLALGVVVMLPAMASAGGRFGTDRGARYVNCGSGSRSAWGVSFGYAGGSWGGGYSSIGFSYGSGWGGGYCAPRVYAPRVYAPRVYTPCYTPPVVVSPPVCYTPPAVYASPVVYSPAVVYAAPRVYTPCYTPQSSYYFSGSYYYGR